MSHCVGAWCILGNTVWSCMALGMWDWSVPHGVPAGSCSSPAAYPLVLHWSSSPHPTEGGVCVPGTSHLFSGVCGGETGAASDPSALVPASWAAAGCQHPDFGCPCGMLEGDMLPLRELPPSPASPRFFPYRAQHRGLVPLLAPASLLGQPPELPQTLDKGPRGCSGLGPNTECGQGGPWGQSVGQSQRKDMALVSHRFPAADTGGCRGSSTCPNHAQCLWSQGG